MNEIIQTMADQINAKELKFAKFMLLADENLNQVTVRKGTKFMRITYNESHDSYDIQKGKIKGFDISEEPVESGYYCDMLQDAISRYFNFEYVMEQFIRC